MWSSAPGKAETILPGRNLFYGRFSSFFDLGIPRKLPFIVLVEFFKVLLFPPCTKLLMLSLEMLPSIEAVKSTGPPIRKLPGVGPAIL